MSAGHARLDAGLTRGSRLAGRVGLAALFVLFGCESLQTRGRQWRYAHALDASHAHRREHHHHLQAQRPLRRRGAEENQLVPARLAAPGRRPAWIRSLLDIVWEVAARSPRAEADRDRVRLSRTGDQRDAAQAQQRRRQGQPCIRYGQAMDFYIPGRAARSSCATPDCVCSAAGSASIRRPARRSCTSTPAKSGIGRHQRARNWHACSRTGARFTCRAMDVRCRVMRSRSPTSRSAARARRNPRSTPRKAPASPWPATPRTRAHRAAKTTRTTTPPTRPAGQPPQNRRRRPTEPLKPCQPNRRRFALLQCRCRASVRQFRRRPSPRPGARRRTPAHPVHGIAAKVLRRSTPLRPPPSPSVALTASERFRRGVGLCTGVSSPPRLHRAPRLRLPN